MTVYIIGATNPTSGGNYSLDVSTSEDPAVASTFGYQIAAATSYINQSARRSHSRAQLPVVVFSRRSTASAGLEANAALAGGSATLELRGPSGTFSRAQLPITTSSTSPTLQRRRSRPRLGAAALTTSSSPSEAIFPRETSSTFSPATSSTQRPATTASRCSAISRSASSSTLMFRPLLSPLPTEAASAGYWLVTKTGTVYGVGGATSLGNVTTSVIDGPRGGDSEHTRWGRLLGGDG